MTATSQGGIGECRSCAAACCRLQVLLIDDPRIPERLIESSDWGGQVMRRLADGWCAGLDRTTFRCTIYAQRPHVCRDFEMGGSECRDEWHSSPHIPAVDACVSPGGKQ